MSDHHHQTFPCLISKDSSSGLIHHRVYIFFVLLTESQLYKTCTHSLFSQRLIPQIIVQVHMLHVYICE